ncbi:MAG: hypothetical protein DKM50_03380 [Candidatus Margulisiibacteriota bacterium]|nr:MAG: hypothetical protein A2X43_09520 [Candidatus Margulisbacteria bacterium GWD2_39_127]OGI02872.1 MAG: hypothetical protein A2X42_02245 [Candidatus Margulisbacteria bacterium GWF2_38_17]OGI09653.1 MAG: hypothetical protein A2X41_04955 [Candidatus Margulisbacteria bacterium GWE2_39_32]PZM83021.1 MAG: hypothetical protein DKM50_03380 [Candidatus Margulisiibacteriota bacterium]HAR62181.1 hydantoinase [Candidatus Margulisiibacteriota bacterium]
MLNKVRIGIDVGGTFTHAAALTADRFALIAQSKVPTTHDAKEGVALGIIHALRELMELGNINPDQISCIAHSTTQATNALLEGDVSPVGIIAVGCGIEGKMVRAETILQPIELAPGRFLTSYHKYIELEKGAQVDPLTLATAIEELKQNGVAAIVAVTAFSVDNPVIENEIAEIAREHGLPATATHEISSLYGLTARTRTAAINAAIMPKMIYTADMTKLAALSMNIHAPLVVMRSDGGAMNIEEMKKRPILTLLSGPAAGVAAALMAAKIADGIFLEVGGTSTDISCIINGHPSIKMARIGDHKIYLNTIDIRTIGVAGGSLAAIKDSKIVGVGPRSAHIAGLKYSAFAGHDKTFDTSVPKLISLKSDSCQYLALEHPEDRSQWTVTTTCAANQLDLVPKGDYAEGNKELVNSAFKKFSDFLGTESPNALASEIMEIGAAPIIDTVTEIIREKKLEISRLALVGGGGGASVWINYIGGKIGCQSTLVENAPVISAIGAAMALLQETVERTIIDPCPQDFIDIREKAETSLIRGGANPESIEVRVEVDSQRGVLRATAVGSLHMVVQEETLSETELLLRAEKILNVSKEDVALVAMTSNFIVFQGKIIKKQFWGLIKKHQEPWTVLDLRGRVRMGAAHGKILILKSGQLAAKLSESVNEYSIYGDGGQILPSVFLVTNSRTVDLSGLVSVEQMISICQEEQKRLSDDDNVVLAINIDNR